MGLHNSSTYIKRGKKLIPSFTRNLELSEARIKCVLKLFGTKKKHIITPPQDITLHTGTSENNKIMVVEIQQHIHLKTCIIQSQKNTTRQQL
jgi:hypothetical protein